jgi:DNA-binding transcriptional regulator of glucitol operon
LLFSYFLQCREGMDALALGDLIRCCIRAGVDTRNFNRALGTLTRRGFLETVRPGHAYRLSDQGVAAVESRM